MISKDGMFVGKEVEHTNQYGKPTLFVVTGSLDSVKKALAELPKVCHIYLGAGGTGSIPDLPTLRYLLDAKYDVTIEWKGPPASLQDFLHYPNLTVVLPFTLLGQRNLLSHVLLEWLEWSTTNQGNIFVKIDTHHPHCWQIPLQQLVNNWTKPEHYSGDTAA